MEKASLHEILLHPGIFIILSTIILYVLRNSKTFSILAVVFPIIAAIICSKQPDLICYNFYDLWQFSFQYNHYNRIACLCILLCFSCINLSAYKQRHCNYSIILATLYAGINIVSMLSVDFSTMVYSLEFSSLAAALMIYKKNNECQIETAYYYLIVHSLSAMLILAGSSIIVNSYGLPIINLAKVIQDFEYNYIAAVVILLGLLINIACPMFSYWLVNSYSVSGTIESAYLSITTTINLIWILKLFLGLKILIIIGILITVFGIIYAILENEIKRSFSYSFISKSGIMLIMIGAYQNNPVDFYNDIILLCISYILCQSFFMLMCSWLKDKYQLIFFTDFSSKVVAIDSILLISISCVLVIFFAVPFTTICYANILALNNNNITHFINITIAAQLLYIPWILIYKNIKIKFIQAEYINIAEYITVIYFTIINLILYSYTIDFTYLLQQLAIITAGFIASYISCPSKISGKILLPESILYNNIQHLITLYSNKIWQLKLQLPQILRSSNNLNLSHSLTIGITIVILLTLIIIDIM
ncbi:NADH-Ubiquinone/plastoquinone (complex I), various chains family protein [Orientia chuto str. Dubai]|uniref:NADH-Ubiquinone/plastoquinone (Complex I), various chains family protein n=1 Tax=Orientia chuto str. Dubai TaxID=1359168 RepID=A0A0F3MRP9_9RICK|nr:proton-conducting transporter membrane subunit [Candidatus Orientia mediorientalis]KJV57274.1 NADH-Ubiquinone/plastoquinone (complex I), various chains family protein [Orientia chuto str. Dubai]